jgi:hypothetical protein
MMQKAVNRSLFPVSVWRTCAPATFERRGNMTKEELVNRAPLLALFETKYALSGSPTFLYELRGNSLYNDKNQHIALVKDIIEARWYLTEMLGLSILTEISDSSERPNAVGKE